jgi:hypothetical protein
MPAEETAGSMQNQLKREAMWDITSLGAYILPQCAIMLDKLLWDLMFVLLSFSLALVRALVIIFLFPSFGIGMFILCPFHHCIVDVCFMSFYFLQRLITKNWPIASKQTLNLDF